MPLGVRIINSPKKISYNFEKEGEKERALLREMASPSRGLLAHYNFSEEDQKKYPVLTRILKELTPERIKREIEAVQRVKLPPELQRWVGQYNKVGERGEFLWKWLYKVVQSVFFSSVFKKYLKSVWKIKSLVSMFVILIDDIADLIKNKKLLNELLKIPFEQINIGTSHFSEDKKRYLAFAVKLWRYIKTKAGKYPRFYEFRDVFDYDIGQIVNSMKYASLINSSPYLINEQEYWLYFPYSMQAAIYSTLDLMCSPKFNIREIGLVRDITLEAQKMARIGNWVSTWEREVADNDFTSGIFAYAVNSDILTPDDLIKFNKEEIIKRIKTALIDKILLREWEEGHRKIKKTAKRIKTIDTEKFLMGLETLLILEMAAKFYK